MSKNNNTHKKLKKLSIRKNKEKRKKEVKKLESLFNLLDEQSSKLEKVGRNKETLSELTKKTQFKETSKQIVFNDNQGQKTENFNYIISPEKIDIENSILNQYICLACYSINLVEESTLQETEQYSERHVECRKCKEITPQICLKNEATAKLDLKLSNLRTPLEENAYQALSEKNKRQQKVKKR